MDTQSADNSPWSVMLEGWVDDKTDHNDHDVHESHEDEDDETHNDHGNAKIVRFVII